MGGGGTRHPVATVPPDLSQATLAAVRRRVILWGVVPAVALAWPAVVLAHGELVYPESRTPGIQRTYAPCGESVPGDLRTKFAPGETILVGLTLSVNHDGYLRIAFSPADDTGFGQAILADDVPDVAGTYDYQIEVTFPECRCTNCSLQLRQVLPSGNAAYYSCADIELVAADPDNVPECEAVLDPGEGDTGGSTGGTGGTSGSDSTGGDTDSAGTASGASGCRTSPDGGAALLLPLLLGMAGRRRRAVLWGAALTAIFVAGCSFQTPLPPHDVDRDSHAHGAESTGASTGGSTSATSAPVTDTSADASSTGSTTTGPTSTTTGTPIQCGGVGDTGNSTGADSPWLELTQGDLPLTPGSSLELICGGQGGVMFLIEAWFGAFAPTAYSVPMTVSMDVPGFPVGPSGQFFLQEGQLDLNCTADSPEGVLILILPPDSIEDPYALQGASGTVNVTIETPEGPADFEVGITVSVPADLWCV
jgi:hypothetical protein